ncbi:MAG: DUF4328 domain-containing protein [Bacteroidetes bacterium]|nr:DUF4328 domain-containing protein [Bacteroidota bacterium]
MTFNNHKLTKLLLFSLSVLMLVNTLDFVFNIYDVSYLRKIISGANVTAWEDNFYILKNRTERWVSFSTTILYWIIFIPWFYWNYKNVYLREIEQAPFKPRIVPFSFILPVFNLYGPYKIMKFIWYGNSETEEEVKIGYKRIKLWWFLSVLIWSATKLLGHKYSNAENADQYLTFTYWYLLLNAVSIHWSILTMQIAIDIRNMENKIHVSQVDLRGNK